MAHRKCSVNASSLLSSPSHPISLQEQELGLTPTTVPEAVQCCMSGGVQHVDLVMMVVRTQDTTIKHKKVPITTTGKYIVPSKLISQSVGI